MLYLPKEIPFNIPFTSKNELPFLADAISRKEYAGGGHYTHLCEEWLKAFTLSRQVLLTSSCTHALEMCAILCQIQPGDEVIMSSFNYVSAANAFALRGARIVFVDIRPDTMNIDEDLIEAAITPKTKVILAMHYGGVGCEMDKIMAIADAYSLIVVEDAAHSIGASYKGRHLGTIGHLGTLSFHATKNIHCGEGGALLVNDNRYEEMAEIIREKGTNRKQFDRGEVQKYTWIALGSSYIMNELTAAVLYAQLLECRKVVNERYDIWNSYQDGLNRLNVAFEMPYIPEECRANGHIFYIKLKDSDQRKDLIHFLKNKGIQAYFHYVPLHLSKAGMNYGYFYGGDNFTNRDSNRLLRLPLYAGLQNINYIVDSLMQFQYEGQECQLERMD